MVVSTTRGSAAYVAIKRRIVRLDIHPGEMVGEAQLAAELGLSKTPVREALGRLQTEHLVEVVGRSGYRVAPVTLKNVRDLLAVRVLLEAEAAAGAAAQVAAGYLSENELKALSDLAELDLEPNSYAEIESFVSRNAKFHAAVAQIAGNFVLADLLDEVLTKSQRLHYLYIRLAPRSHIREHEHEAYIRAISRGNAEEAREEIRGLLESIHADMIEVLLSSPALQNTNIGLSS